MRAPASRPPPVLLECLNGPRLIVAGRAAPLAEGNLRTLVFLAMTGRPVSRKAAWTELWPDAAVARASGNLRSALWRLRALGIEVATAGDLLVLPPDVVVDVHRLDAWARRRIESRGWSGDLAVPAGVSAALNLLPGWYDDWVIFERERLRQRLLHALDRASTELSAAGRHAEAVEAAMSAVCADPLRESGQRALLRAHLAEGNRSEARRCYEAYRQVLDRELGVAPPHDLVDRY